MDRIQPQLTLDAMAKRVAECDYALGLQRWQELADRLRQAAKAA